MTATPPGTSPATQDRSALRRLLHADPTHFAERSWGTAPLLVTHADRDGDTFGDLFSLDAVDELLTHRALRTPFLRLAQNGSTLPESRFTRGGGTGADVADQVDEDRVRTLFAQGATIVLQGLHRTWPPIAAFARTLGDDLGHPVQVNAYITPPQNQGFSAHYDVHDVFVLQVHGTKHWTVHRPVVDNPLRSQPWDTVADEVAHRAATDAPLIDAALAPGDVLYLPRGTIHSATARGEISAHLTIGVHPWTPDHVTQAVLDAVRTQLQAQPELRANLPLGARPDDPTTLDAVLPALRSALHEAVDSLDAESLARGFRPRVRSTRRPDPAPPLAHLAAAEALGPESTVRLRGGLELGDDTSRPQRVQSRLGWFDLTDDEQAVVDQLTASPAPTRVDALPAEAAVVQNLVRRGLLEVLP